MTPILKTIYFSTFILSTFQFSLAQSETKLVLTNIEPYEPVRSGSSIVLETDNDYSFEHMPEKEDEKNADKLKLLIKAKPNEKNYENYFKLACSLWELGRLDEAKSMFMEINASNGDFYKKTYYHTSDISGDTNSNIYGYGSFTTHYKNSSCRYLAKIYIEQKEFTEALHYVSLADKKYPIHYTCGTGYMFDRNEMDGLYAICYENLGEYDKIIHLFMPVYSEGHTNVLVRAIKQVYSQKEIEYYLSLAQDSMVFVADTFPSSTFTIENYGKEDQQETEARYFSGTAKTILFGFDVRIKAPDFEDGVIATREDFINEFKRSGLYQKLGHEK